MVSWPWLPLRSQLADPFGEVKLAVQEGAGDSPHFRDATEVHFLATVYESADAVFGPLPCSRSPSFSMLDHAGNVPRVRASHASVTPRGLAQQERPATRCSM